MSFCKGCLSIAFLLCLFSGAYAQVSPAVLEGKIATEGGAPADASTVVLLKYKDSSIVNSGIADTKGLFSFKKLQADTYLLLISKAGYKKMYAGPFELRAGETVTTPDIVLKEQIQTLNEVSVVSSRPEIEAQPGKLVINVQSSLQAQGSSAFDILRQSPGVRVDNSNNISIIGRQNALITIDGKPTNLSGEDLIGVLRTIQSSNIDRIELITAGSAKYDASAGGIINIVLKKGKNTGFNATVTGTAGYGRYYKSGAGVTFNDRTDKVNIFGNYNFADNKTFHDFTTDRTINFSNLVSNYNTAYNSIQKNQVNTFGFGTDFYLSRTQTVGFYVNGSISNDNITKDNNLAIYNQAIFDSTITANSNLNRHVSRINYNLNYTGKLGANGATLSADANYSTYNRSSAEYIANNFFDAGGNEYMPPLLLQNISPSQIHIYLGKIDFSDPLTKTSRLEGGVKFSDVTSNNDLIFGPYVNGRYTSDASVSDHFHYDENVNAAYLNFENKFDKWDVTAGLRAEQTEAKGTSDNEGLVLDYNYMDLFPQVLLSFNPSDKKQFSLSYHRGIERPAYEDVNPFLYYVDVYDYRSGNPNLKPDYTNSVELSYDYNKSLLTTLYVSIIDGDYGFNFYDQNDTSKVNVTTTKNLGNVYNYGVRFNAPASFTNWWNANFNADISYQRYVAYPQNGNLNKGTQDVILSTTQTFSLSKRVSAELAGFYESPTFYGVNYIRASYFVNGAVGLQLFDNRGSLKLSVGDIFNIRRDRAYTTYENLDISTVDKKETQVMRLTFAYRFGRTGLKASIRHAGNDEEEKRMPKGDSGN